MATKRCVKGAAGGAADRHVNAAAAGDPATSCEEPPAVSPAVRPCDSQSPTGPGCVGPTDLVQAQLIALGNAGEKIARAREKVLEILQTENACKAWFQEKDANPAATFRTLSFALDFRGDEYVVESSDIGPMNIFRNPYVAKVIQGDGPYATITLNAKGAFFSTMARVVELHKGGGPSSFRGTYLLHVGPFDGDTLPAQVITLLHEFGHVLDLLPADLDDLDGKSGRNTNEVLRSCSGEIASWARRNMLSAGH
jgi:hypothetical protein